MNFIDSIFFFYFFVGTYMISLLVMLYLKNRKDLFSYPPAKLEPVSIVVPCYNEEKHIGKTIESLLNLDYPKDMIEIIVVDDKSSDNSAEVVRDYVEKYDNVRLIVNKRNSGGAAEPTNIGIKAAKYEYIAVTDADSFPDRENLKRMLGFLQNDTKVGAVTCAVLAKRPESFWQKVQALEYKIIAFNRKLLDYIDSVYVTPGPFALYRKKTLFEVGLFDIKNMTQDIEIVWRLLHRGYKARMSLSAKVYSVTPKKFGAWWRQRIRWNIGGNQTIRKYFHTIFRGSMLGYFIIPFFSFSMFLGVFGLSLFSYLLMRRFLVSYLVTKFSINAGSEILTLQDISFMPSILNFFGVCLFVISFLFSLVALYNLKDGEYHNANIFNVLFYAIVYLAVYPFIMIAAFYKMIRKSYKW